ncbi:MAG: putative glycosyltransferase EpsD [Pelotomaculum sp. PtaB.Bin104]|nr:MAG: putative glycosyltransferase EpsD [Pelotomaculum sp. PtaB.Bin104]
MARVKVLQVITLSEMGGAQKIVYHLAAGLDPELFEITVACGPGGELIDWLKNLPQTINIILVPELKRNISLVNDFKALWKLYHLMKRNSFDIVHCHSSKAGILGRTAAYLTGTSKIFFTVHGWGINEYQSEPVRLFYSWVERLAGAVSSRIVCVSENDLVRGRSLRLARDDKFMVIYNGMPEPKKQAGVLRRKLNVRKEDIIVGTVARLANQKAPLFFLEVAGRMIENHGNNSDSDQLYFVLIGDGPLRSDCEEFIERSGLNGRVFLLGTREEAVELVQDFDIFVLFSRWEGLPLTIIEAMLAGKPVVANAVGGVSELVVHQQTGYLISGLDLAAAEKALQDLVFNKDRRLSMGTLGRQRARDLFSINKMIEKYRELYLS